MTNKPLLGPRKTKMIRNCTGRAAANTCAKALDLSKIVTRRFSAGRTGGLGMAAIVVRLYTIQMLKTEDYARSWQPIPAGIRR